MSIPHDMQPLADAAHVAVFQALLAERTPLPPGERPPLTAEQAPLRVSRSAIQTRQACEMRRYLQYEWGGTGLERPTASLPLIGGNHGHSVLARAVMGANLDQALAEEQARYEADLAASGVHGVASDHLAFLIHEQRTLFEGLVRGWVKFRLPSILEEYEPMEAEREAEAEVAPGLVMPIRLDLLMRRRADGMPVVFDFKFLSYLRDGWDLRYLHDLQTPLYIEAAERLTGEYIGGIQYEVLLKGGRKKGSEKGPWSDRELQQSPLCYGYAIRSADGSVAYQADYTARKGAEKIAVWEEFDDVADWWESVLTEADYRALFHSTGLLKPTPQERQRILGQITQRERVHVNRVVRIEAAAPDQRVAEAARHLEQNGDTCIRYGTRYKCPYYDICYNDLVAADPLGSGLYIPHADHHQPGPDDGQE